MKLKYYGTAAAEGWPAIFCSCEACEKARKAGGRNIRTRSQAMIDDKLLIDFPADTYMHELYYGLDLQTTEHCIITHNHSDHFYPADLGMRNLGFAHLKQDAIMTFYGTSSVAKSAINVIRNQHLEENGRIRFREILPYQPVTIDTYCVTALKANHDPNSDPVFYSIAGTEKAMLYAHDTGYFPDESWAYLIENKPFFHFVSLDCTGEDGVMTRDYHMDIFTCREVADRLIEIGCASKETIFCVNHFSHNGITIYDDLVNVAKKLDFLVSYDGMEIIF